MSRYDTKPIIMIIDDEPINIRYIGNILDQDYELLTFTSGDSAFKYLLENEVSPDLILLDIVMPTLSGFEMCEKLKNEPKTANIPVIFITALMDERDEEKGFLVGGADYIKKPFSKTVAKSRIDNLIRLKQYQDILEKSSNIDALTKISNRKHFNEMLSREFLSLRRYKGDLSCLIMDIDNFKLYNDNYGHIAGDECLKRVASCIDKTLSRKNDFCARFGGEEFVVLLPGTNQAGAKITAEAIRKNIFNENIKHEFSMVSDRVTVSIGCATINESSLSDEKTFLETADQALYAAKKSGKNRVVCEATIQNIQTTQSAEFPTPLDVCSSDIVEIDISSSLVDALNKIANNDVRNLVVKDRDSYYFLSSGEVLNISSKKENLDKALSMFELRKLRMCDEYSSLLEIFLNLDNECQIVGLKSISGGLSGVITNKNLINATYSFDDNSLQKPISYLLECNNSVAVKKHDTLFAKFNALESSTTDCLIVVDDGYKPVGIITKRDVVKLIARGVSLEQPMEALMHKNIDVIDLNTSINSAFFKMQEKNYKRIIAIDEDGNLAGVVTQLQILDTIYTKLLQKGYFRIDKISEVITRIVDAKSAKFVDENIILKEQVVRLEHQCHAMKIKSILKT